MAEKSEKVSFNEFKEVYDKNVKAIYALWTPDMQAKIARHNIDWGAPYSFENYLYRSVDRFYRAYMAIPSNNSKCLDIGGFWGVFPTTLADLGMNVNMTEAKKYYDSSFNQIFEFIEGKNVVIHDIDPFEENLSGSYDFISVMAVLEHIPFSLKYFMSNVKSVMAEPCTLYVDVPNIAYYFKRRDLAMGKTPLPGILSIYNSEKPFIGHHHEFTMKELVDLFKMEELHVDKVDSFNYSIKPSARFALSNPLAFVCLQFFPGMREVISIQARNKV